MQVYFGQLKKCWIVIISHHIQQFVTKFPWAVNFYRCAHCFLVNTITNNGDLTPTSVKLEELSAQTQRGIAPLNFNRSFLRWGRSICFYFTILGWRHFKKNSLNKSSTPIRLTSSEMSMNVTMVFFPRVYFEFNSLFNCYVSISWNLCFISFAIFIISRVLFWDWSSVQWLRKNLTHFNFDRLYGWYVNILRTSSLIISAIVTSLSRVFWDPPSLSFLVIFSYTLVLFFSTIFTLLSRALWVWFSLRLLL